MFYFHRDFLFKTGDLLVRVFIKILNAREDCSGSESNSGSALSMWPSAFERSACWCRTVGACPLPRGGSGTSVPCREDPPRGLQPAPRLPECPTEWLPVSCWRVLCVGLTDPDHWAVLVPTLTPAPRGVHAAVSAPPRGAGGTASGRGRSFGALFSSRSAACSLRHCVTWSGRPQICPHHPKPGGARAACTAPRPVSLAA